MEGGGSGWWPERPDRDERGQERGADRGGSGPRPPGRRPRGLESRRRPRVASRYSLFVGLAFLAIAVLAVVNAIRTDEGGIAGADREADRGVPIPQFAVPDVLTDLSGDANVAQDDCESSRNPCPADQVRVPACRIDVPGAIRVCDLFDRPLAISFWFTRGGDCLPSQDAFAEVAASRSREANFLSVNVIDDRAEVAAIVRERGWELPVGHDADGAVSNLLGIGVCPSIVLAYPGGIIDAVEIKPGNFDVDEIEAMIDGLVARSERREGGRSDRTPGR